MLPKLTIVSYLSAADWWVFFGVLALTLAAALYGHYRKKRPKNKALDYLLMGRQLTLPLFVATLVATWYGGIFGVNEITFNYGIYNFVTQGFFWYIAYLIFAFFIAEKVAKYHSVTLPDLAGRMFGPKAAKVAAVFTFFYITPVAYVLSLGLFLNMAFGMSVLQGMIYGTLFVCLYTMWGGFKSVVFSDLVQFFVMCSSVLIVVLFSDPSFYQRCFAAKSPQVVKKGVLISTFIWFCFDICTTAGSLYARALLPQAEPAEAYFFYAVQLLPSGLRGFFIAGILAIILSTLNSFLFIASNTLSFDLLRNRFRNIVLSNRIAMLAVGALAVGMALLFDGSFKEIWLTLGSYFSACLLMPILLGYIYPHRISDNLFVTSALCSAAAMTLWRLLPLTEFWKQFDPFYVGVLTGALILLFNLRKGKSYVKSITDL